MNIKENIVKQFFLLAGVVSVMHSYVLQATGLQTIMITE